MEKNGEARRMTFLARRPLVFIVAGIICLVLIIGFSGVLVPKPPVTISASFSSPSIKMGANSTMTATIDNKGSRQYSIEYRIVGTFTGEQLKFYEKINGTTPLLAVGNGKNYTITYPKTRTMNVGEEWSISVYVKGMNPGGSSYTYTIFVEAWVDNALSDRESVKLTVTS